MAYCVICTQAVERWLPHPRLNQAGSFPRLVGCIGPDPTLHGCPNCQCTDFERHLLMYMQALEFIDRMPGWRILHVGPEKHIESLIRSMDCREYVCADIAPTSPELRRIDFQKLPFSDGYFDLIICNNVLQRVPDPDRALKELARCLSRSGKLIAQTPFSPALKSTFEMIRDVSPAFAEVFFAHERNVRLFGSDLLGRIHAAGLQGEPLAHGKALVGMDPLEYGCNVHEPLFLFTRR